MLHIPVAGAGGPALCVCGITLEDFIGRKLTKNQNFEKTTDLICYYNTTKPETLKRKY